MKIFALCVVRDEADVLPYTIDAALAWATRIYVTDDGSTDGSWELLQRYAAEHPEVVLCGREAGVYRPDVRGEMANAHFTDARVGDWWCRLDADEIYIDDPRVFLTGVAPRDHVVWSASVQYYFTDEDLRRYDADPAAYTIGWAPERCRYYRANWSEPRFVRHQEGRRWAGDWPENFRWRRTAPDRIRLRHYQYRSPPQIEHRLRLRRAAGGSFRHEKGDGWLVGSLSRSALAFPEWSGEKEPWRARVVKAAALHDETAGGEVIVDRAELPPLPGSLPRRALRRLWRSVKP